MAENNGAAFFTGPAAPREQLVFREVMPALLRQLDSLIRLGIGYLTLSRAVDTLSSGEHQRLRLASLLANRLNHTLFILDEMSRGLHPFDVSNLLGILRELLQGGNTIAAVDHHPLVISQADWTVRLGPGSGRHGGRVLYMGNEKPAPRGEATMTAAGIPTGIRPIVIGSAKVNNLDRLDLSIPATGLTVCCGVSGSGKSTLLHRVIHESFLAGQPVHCTVLSGLEHFRQTVSFSPRNPLRYGSEKLSDFLDLTDAIHGEFIRAAGRPGDRSQLKKALAAPSAASGCRHCDGRGEWTTDLDYLGSFTEPCTHCRGSGLSPELGQLRLLGETLADMLACDIDALPEGLTARLQMGKAVSCLQEFALGYLTLGRRLHSLSAGELQRLRLARLFLNLQDAPCLLLLDEPDSGLSFDECRQLILTMKKHLAPSSRGGTAPGHAAIVISHHPLMMCQADYLIDLGPGAGEEGGKVTAAGTPREILAGSWPLSKTAAYLKRFLQGNT
jgi:excinuclease ABC subunit A